MALMGGAALCSAAGCGPRATAPNRVVIVRADERDIVRVDQLDQLPVLREWPAVAWRDSLQAATDSARITVQFVLETTGRVRKNSIMDVASSRTGLVPLAEEILSQAVFSPPRMGGEPRRVLVELTLDLARLTATPSPRLSEGVALLESMVDERPEVLLGPQLDYPDRARLQCITGRVVIQAVIGRDGRAETRSVHVIQRVDPDLDWASLQYVARASFKPGKVRGAAVRTLVNIPIDFKIRGGRC